jgi:hypothetical protein
MAYQAAAGARDSTQVPVGELMLQVGVEVNFTIA